MVLVANFDYLRAKAPRDAIVRCLLDHFQEHGEALDVEALLPLAERDWVDGLHRVMPASFAFPEGAAGAFTEGTFYPAFQQDLARARESVVIFSPFATGPGTGRWVDPLRAALAGGVRVRILTRPPRRAGRWHDQRGGRAGGRAARPRRHRRLARPHASRRFAILDGRILWHGSLNVLSHRDTHESMLRIESVAACEQIGRFVSTPMGRDEEATAFHAAENPACPKCNGPTVWKKWQVWRLLRMRGCGLRWQSGRAAVGQATAPDGRQALRFTRTEPDAGRQWEG